MSDKIKILIVDDSSFMRNILARIVARDSRFDVVGKAKDGAEGVAMVKSLKPDVVTMDIEMPIMNGIEALKVIMKENPTPVVMVSSLTREGATATLEAMDYGAVDFIPKAMDDGAISVLSNSAVLMEKIYEASKARIIPSSRKPPLAMRTPLVRRTPITPAATITPRVKRLMPKTNLSMAKLFIIGSSTGGPRALQDVIPNLPENLRIPVVVAQHMPANFTGPMAERLDSISKITVVEAKDGDILKAGTVYIAPGGVHTRISSHSNCFKLSIKEDTGSECVYRPSVDILADSVAKNVGGNVLALMLTGMGMDGAKGFESLKKKGCYIISQDEETSVVYGMPKSVASISDEILPLNDIISAIVRLVGR